MNNNTLTLKSGLDAVPKVIFKFASVGLLATLVHTAIFFMLQSLGLNPVASNFFAWLTTVSISYLGHKNWTFSDNAKTDTSTQTKAKFLVNSLIALAANTLFTYVFSTIIPNTFLIIVSIGFFTPLISFLLMKYWVFIAKT